ncbi:MAG: diacylglycerol kinase family protein [Tannerellaceae bacterium]|jgi:diacylglycerol kinase (ATP)|nr:diacylglycerol kinase family protein [Tannerellaceae bacterium]
MKNEDFSFRKRFISFKYAFRGIARLFRYEHNAWIHAVIGIITVIAGFLCRISCAEWVVVILVTGIVLAAETFNSSIEKLADVVSPEYSKAIRDIKDLSAGAVLFTAMTAVLIGLIIFLPKLMDYFIL